MGTYHMTDDIDGDIQRQEYDSSKNRYFVVEAVPKPSAAVIDPRRVECRRAHTVGRAVPVARDQNESEENNGHGRGGHHAQPACN